MADRYVYSAAVGSGDGTSMANAFTNLQAAYAVAVAGDRIICHEAHDYNYTANATLAIASSFSTLNRLICVVDGASVPPVAADLRYTARERTTGAFSITVSGSVIANGVSLQTGSGTASTSDLILGSASGNYQIWKNCVHGILGTASGSRLRPSNTQGARVRFENVGLLYGAVGQGLQVTGACEIVNDRATTTFPGTTPTALIAGNGSSCTKLYARGLDLGGLTNLTSTSMSLEVELEDCEVPASWTLSSATQSSFPWGGARFRQCTSDGRAAGDVFMSMGGVASTDRDVVRTLGQFGGGGANDGQTSFSYKVVTGTLASDIAPVKFAEFEVHCMNPGRQVTVEVHGVTDNVALTNREAYLEIDYQNTAGDIRSTKISSAPATELTAASGLASSSDTWATPAITTPLKQKMSVTFTPRVVGKYRGRIVFTKASATAWFCPQIEVF